MASVEKIHRLMRLIELLQSGRAYNSTLLADLCDVSRRTIFRDLATLQDSGVPIHYDQIRQGYTLPDTTLLPSTDFSLDEALSLLILCYELGDEATGIPFTRSARTAANKLLSALPVHLREYLGELTELISLRIDARNPLIDSRSHYDQITQAISERQQIRIRYHSLFEREEITTVLSPYRLLFSRRSWYAIGRSSLHRSVRTFNIGRILKAETLESRYKIPPRFSLDRHLGNAWHLIPQRGERHNVVIRFQKKVAENVAEVQWHKTQKTIINDDGTLDFYVTVDGLSEIVWWILGYGSQAEVLRPKKLRGMLESHIESMRNIYRTNRQTTTARSRKK